MLLLRSNGNLIGDLSHKQGKLHSGGRQVNDTFRVIKGEQLPPRLLHPLTIPVK